MDILNDVIDIKNRVQLKRLTSYPVCNPSIQVKDGKLLCVYRGSNYYLRENGYGSIDKDGNEALPDHQTYLVHLDENLGEIDYKIASDTKIRRHSLTRFGLMDNRVFSWQGKTLMLGAAYIPSSSDPIGYECTQVLSELQIDGSLRVRRIYKSLQPQEKNWVPVCGDGDVRIMYQPSPPVVFNIRENPECAPETLLSGALPLRGGSSVEYFEGHYYAITHTTAYLDDSKDPSRTHFGRRRYLHYLVKYDKDLNIETVSDPFQLEGEEVEFCTGLQFVGDDVYISFGIWDERAVVWKVATRELLALVSRS